MMLLNISSNGLALDDVSELAFFQLKFIDEVELNSFICLALVRLSGQALANSRLVVSPES